MLICRAKVSSFATGVRVSILGIGAPRAVQDHVQQDSGLHSRPTTHLAYRASRIRLAGTITSRITRPSFGRETPTVGDDLLFSSPDLPIGTVLSSSPPLRLRQAPPGLGRNCWRLLHDKIVEGRMTEIEYGLRRPVTLHQADDGIHWFCHEILPELNGLSSTERLSICSDI